MCWTQVIWAFVALVIWMYGSMMSILPCYIGKCLWIDVSITDKWLVIDEDIPPLDYLIIEGGLHAASDASLHFTLNVNYIIIAGRLIIGWENEPFNGTAKIILRGQQSSPIVPFTDGPHLGAKVMGKLANFMVCFAFLFVHELVKMCFLCLWNSVMAIWNMHGYSHTWSFTSSQPQRSY